MADPRTYATQTSEILDRMPPNDLEAERGVLGSVILDPPCIDDLGGLAADEFYAEAHRKLFARLRSLADSRRAIDPMLLVHALKESGDYDAAGGSAYLAEIIHSVPVAAHAAHYAARVRRCAKLRAMIHAATDMLRDAYDPTLEPEEILERSESALTAIETGDYRGGPVTMADAVTQALERIDEARRRRSGAGTLTGISGFDFAFGGLFPGELTILAARPRIGKTALSAQIAHYVGTHGRLAYMASLEMSGAELATRLLCGFAGVSNHRIRTGQVDDQDQAALVEASNVVAPAQAVIHDRAGLSCQDIARAARRYAGKGLALVIVDYLQRITPRDRRMQRYEQIGDMVRALKELAREMAVPVLCLAQVGRSAEARDRPTLADLRESGDIEAEADVVTFLHRAAGPQEPDGRIPVTWIIEKNRNGATGDVPLKFRAAGTRFESVNGSEWNG